MIRRSNKPNQKKIYRLNQRIFASTLRVLDASGEMIGVLPKNEALKLAQEQELDLVEVAPKAQPPVAKIIDFNKFLYQKAKKEKEEKKHAKSSDTKEVRLSPFISDNDFQVAVRKTREFLEEGHKIKLVVKFKGRQIVHPEFGHKIIQKVLNDLSEISKLDRETRFEGRQLVAVMSPDKKKRQVKEPEKL